MGLGSFYCFLSFHFPGFLPHTHSLTRTHARINLEADEIE